MVETTVRAMSRSGRTLRPCSPQTLMPRRRTHPMMRLAHRSYSGETALMLSAWEPISLTRSTESSLWPALHRSTGEMFESIKPSLSLGDNRCRHVNACQGLAAAQRCLSRVEGGPGVQGDRFRFAEVVQKRLLVLRGREVMNGSHHLPSVSLRCTYATR